jgi:1-phosphatidylinositol-4-phosphate 5-kinase
MAPLLPAYATGTFDETTDDLRFAGAVVSIICSLFILHTYKKLKGFRKHPAGLMAAKAIFDLLFALLFFIQKFDKRRNLGGGLKSCSTYGLFTQFFSLTSETYFCCFSIDLARSLRDPFVSTKQMMDRFHFYSIGIGFLSMIILAGLDKAGYDEDAGFCWIQSNHKKKYYLYKWGLFHFLVFSYLMFSYKTIFQAWWRLRAGMEETFKTRIGVVKVLAMIVVSYSVYWMIVGTIFATLPGNENRALAMLFSFLVCGGRGLVALAIWLSTQDAVKRLTTSKKKMREQARGEAQANINTALRKEVVFYTTTGIVEAARSAGNPGENDKLDCHLKQTINLKKQHNPNETVDFINYAPVTFTKMRQHFGIDNDSYVESMQATAKERFSEGKSAAFLYFTGDKRYVIKTCTDEECAFFQKILEMYALHMLKHPLTLVTRFYGLHSVRLYGRMIHFCVMESVYPNPNFSIDKRYDLKGSWVKRLDKVGTPNSVGKDLNISQPLALAKGVAEKLGAQLAEDAQFLARANIMDYSLLVGVHNSKFDVRKTTAFRQSIYHSEGAGVLQSEPKSEFGGASLLESDSFRMTKAQKNDVMSGDPSPDRTSRSRSNTKNLESALHNGFAVTKVEGPSIYFMGVIDILQDYNWHKRLETWFKVNIKGSDPYGLSCVHPVDYKDRFIERVVHRLITPWAYNEEDAIANTAEDDEDFTARMTMIDEHNEEDSSETRGKSATQDAGNPMFSELFTHEMEAVGRIGAAGNGMQGEVAEL